MTALTSLSPAPERADVIRECIRSWRDAGLDVIAFNHPSEIGQMRGQYDVRFVPIAETGVTLFGRHVVPVSVMVQWAAEHGMLVLLINADIRLELAPWELQRIRLLCADGLCYFVRYNHTGVARRASREHSGIDAFLFHTRNGDRLPSSSLCMGQPFWDYWLPHAFAARDQPIYAVEFPAAFHLSHETRWSWETWHRCALEFDRVTGVLGGGDESFESCMAMSVHVRHSLDRQKIPVAQRPFPIREWVQRKFGHPGPKLFLELGAHDGTDTAWMARIPEVTIHAFEPDPRNHQVPRHNVTLRRAAIAESDGRGQLILSARGWGQEWTHSSSIKQPKTHLHRFPVTFGERVEVQTVALDTYCRREGLGVVDFIWADVQGAEGDMIRGGRRTLQRARYLFTGYSDDELYEGQPTLAEILQLLPEFRVVEVWPGEVLLENRDLTS